MSNCTNTRPIIGCFKPNDGSPSVSIIIHVIYDEGEHAIGQVYTLGDDNETPIDITSYLGGGTVTAGNCKTYTGSESDYCYDPDGGEEYTQPALIRFCSDGTFEYLDQQGDTVLEIGCCKIKSN